MIQNIVGEFISGHMISNGIKKSGMTAKLHIRASRKSICFALLHPRAIYDYKVDVSQNLRPSGLSLTHDSSYLEICQVLMITVDNDLLRRTF